MSLHAAIACLAGNRRCYPPYSRAQENWRMKDPSSPSILDKLPVELLTHITNHLDTRSAVALALVCRALTTCATDRLWRNVDLTVRRHRYGSVDSDDFMEYPPEFPALPAVPNNYQEMQQYMQEQAKANAEKEEVQMKQGARQRARLESLLAQGAKRWHMVEAIDVSLQAGGAHQVTSILKQVHTTVRKLEIRRKYGAVGAEAHAFETALAGSFPASMRAAGPYFPHLVHLDLGERPISQSETIALLLQLAPNLSSLAFAAAHHPPQKLSASSKPLPPPKTTMISSLRVGCVGNGLSPLWNTPVQDPFATILGVLARSPRLAQLSMSVEHVDEPDAGLADRFAAMENLRDVYWNGNGLELPSSPYVRRLMLDYGYDDWELPSAELDTPPSFPSLEHLFITSHTESIIKLSFPPAAAELPLPSGFAVWLTHHPRLRAIHIEPQVETDNLGLFHEFDELEAPGRENLAVYSIRRGSAELLWVAMRLCDVVVRSDCEGRKAGDRLRIISSVAASLYADQARGSMPSWQLFTDFEGVVVPVGIIKRIKDAEDPARERDWNRRGVEVGEAAWKILTDWRAEQPEPEIADLIV